MSEQNNAKNFVEGVFSAEKNSAASLSQEQLGKYNRLAVRMFHTGVLSPKEMLLPAFGQFSSKLLSGLDAYRTLYFVNVLKIDMAYIVIINALIGIYDSLNDPIMGAIYDRTRTRWGKARPYIIFTSIPYFLSSALLYSGALFFGDRADNDPRKIIFVFVTLFIQETFSTIYSLPRDNILTLQTANLKDRITVGLLNQYIGEGGSSIIYAIFPPIMELNNKGYINLPMPMLYAILGTFSAFVGGITNIAMAVGCHERIILQPKPAPITKTLFYVLKNKYAFRVFLANFATSWWSSGGYSWDVVTQQEIFGGSIPSLLAYMPYNIMDPVSVTFIPKFQKLFKNDNRKAVIVLRLWDLFTCIGMVGIGCPLVDNKYAVGLVYAIFYGINAINNGPANVFEAEVTREINDYTEYMTGERPDGTFGILTKLITKITSPLNALLTIKLFKWSGYDSTITMLPWSQGSKVVYQKVFFLFNGINILPRVVNMIPYIFYDLVGEKREKMYIALNERRALVANEDTEREEMLESLAESLAHETAETK